MVSKNKCTNYSKTIIFGQNLIQFSVSFQLQLFLTKRHYVSTGEFLDIYTTSIKSKTSKGPLQLFKTIPYLQISCGAIRAKVLPISKSQKEAMAVTLAQTQFLNFAEIIKLKKSYGPINALKMVLNIF